MSAQGVAHSVPEAFPRKMLATPGASTWREGSKLWGNLANGPYALAPQRDSHGMPIVGYQLFWVNGEKEVSVAKFDDEAEGLRVMAELADHWRSTCRKQVYFIGSELNVGAPVKIGYSSRVEYRLRQLQSGAPAKLQLFATLDGTVELERRLHTRFRRSRLEGEWFRITPALKRLIERARDAMTSRESV